MKENERKTTQRIFFVNISYNIYFFIKFMKIYACKANSFNVTSCAVFSFWRFDSANSMKGQLKQGTLITYFVSSFIIRGYLRLNF